MMWQDMVFLLGSMTSVMFLFPTLKSAAAQVPRATSVPSMLIGGAYSFTFFTLGMTFSAVGSFAACTMWSLIAAFRAPDSESLPETVPRPVARLRTGLQTQYQRFAGNKDHTPDPVTAEESFDSSAGNETGNGFENDAAANSD